METFKSIVADVDATAAAHPALEQAVELARGSGARLTIVDVVTGDRHDHQDVSSGTEEEMVARRRQALTRLANSVGGVAARPRLLAASRTRGSSTTSTAATTPQACSWPGRGARPG